VPALAAWPVEPAYLVRPEPAGRRERRYVSNLDQPQTVEEIIASGYFVVPAVDPVTALMSDRTFTSKLGLDDVIDQVRARYAISAGIGRDITYAKVAAINALHDWEAYHGWADAKQLASLHRTLQALYQEEREERVNLWRDVSRLRGLLPPAAQQYLSAQRKIELLDDTGGDAR